METETERLAKIVDSSGFPLQIRIEHLVNSTSSSHGWKVRYKEHPWRNIDTGSSGFIDLVLIDKHSTSSMVIECKRKQDSDWIFLLPSKELENRRRARVWITKSKSPTGDAFDWADISTEPSTPESEFCAVLGHDNRSRPMIERIAADVIESTEALAYEENNLTLDFNYMIYFNIVITTAKLWLCNFDPEDISTDTGIIEENKTNFKNVSYLRFRKSLSTKPVDKLNLAEKNYSNLIKAKENTVFVVNSGKFVEFLNNINIDDSSLKNF